LPVSVDALLLIVILLLVLICIGMIVSWRRAVKPVTDTAGSAEVWRERHTAAQAVNDDLRTTLQQLQNRLETAQSQELSLTAEISRLRSELNSERENHREKLQLLNESREQMTLQFKSLANDILEQKGKAFGESSREGLQALLKPLSERIQQFEKKVEESYDKEARERFSLVNEINKLSEMNARISAEAVNLTNALRGESKTQGVWGEMILETVLERSGLVKGREYDVQVSLKTEDGKSYQPDVIVHLPENKQVIIDAKVSLNAYERFCNEEDEELRKKYLRQHIDSIRGHIRGLAEKSYQNLKDVQSLDFVMMFLPVEAAFTAAVHHDERLFQEAFEKNICLVGPSTLLATLRTIQSIWRHEYQNRNALDIAQRAGVLYDKFVAFIEDLEDVGKRIDQAHIAYDSAHRKLSSGRGNILGNIEKLKKLGARASKQLPRQLLPDQEEVDQDEDDQQLNHDALTDTLSPENEQDKARNSD
jgi:DNA recombination protein RmuC